MRTPMNKQNSGLSPQPTQDEAGEGNYDASRRYREGLEKSVQEGNSEQLGEEAKKALEGPEGADLRRAEEQGKRADIPTKK
ncbi:MAG: hypothetical protein U0270_23775 [Labilithrix sp.]